MHSECFECSGTGFESDERMAVVCRICRGRGHVDVPDVDSDLDSDDTYSEFDDSEDLI